MSEQAKKDTQRRAISEIHVKALRRCARTYEDLRRSAQNSLDFAEKMGYKRSKLAEQVLEVCDRELLYIANRDAQVRLIKTGRSEAQMTLVISENRGQAESSPGVQIASSELLLSSIPTKVSQILIVDNNNNNSNIARGGGRDGEKHC